VTTRSGGASYSRYVLRCEQAARQVSSAQGAGDGSVLDVVTDFDELPLFDETELEWV